MSCVDGESRAPASKYNANNAHLAGAVLSMGQDACLTTFEAHVLPLFSRRNVNGSWSQSSSKGIP